MAMRKRESISARVQGLPFREREQNSAWSAEIFRGNKTLLIKIAILE